MITLTIAAAAVAATTISHEGTKKLEGHPAVFVKNGPHVLRPSSCLRETPSGGQQGTVTPRTVDKGGQSNIDQAKQVVIRTEAEWTGLWQQHNPDKKRPDVDFSKEMVVGVFMGSRPTAGYNVSIVSTFAKDGKVIVQYRESTPPRGTMSAQILTFPYHMVAIPKATGEVTFEKVQS